eukprot:scaffold27090_cov69-Phaeocystis_antarctica.AAC.3
MIDLAEEDCPALESCSARRLFALSAHTISHSSLLLLPSVPGPHLRALAQQRVNRIRRRSHPGADRPLIGGADAIGNRVVS